MLDPRLCYKALQTKDERFDGRIFVGVISTGIYCRPVCPVRPPKPENCRFYPSAAAAQEAGFRPCLRCRPETAVDTGSWRGTSNTVSRGLALIADGDLDGDAGIDVLAERLGVGGRQLRRLFRQHLGASPIAVAQTRRVLFAKQLIHETALPMAEIALAAGFGSLRRFNEVFRALYDRPASALRRKSERARDRTHGGHEAKGITVRLRYRAPYDWAAMLAYLRARAIDGVEHVSASGYARTHAQDGKVGTVEVAHLPDENSLAATIRFPDVRALSGIVARIRRLFDLGADASAIDAHLAKDPRLAPMIKRRPGLRAPGAWDGFELAARAICGQQVTVEAGRKLASRLVELVGKTVVTGDPALHATFPSAGDVVAADLGALEMPGARRRALTSLAKAAASDARLFERQPTLDETVARLCTIPGIGDWTAQYVALRAVREPDAFPATDVALLSAFADDTSGRPTSTELLARAERWRPWRAYAAQHLWMRGAS